MTGACPTEGAVGACAGGLSYQRGMGRWKPRNPKLSREERIRLTGLGRDFILEIAKGREWTPFWEFDDPFYAECIFFGSTNPRLDETLNVASVDGGLSWWSFPLAPPDRPDSRWFEVGNPVEREAFVESIDNWLKALTA